MSDVVRTRIFVTDISRWREARQPCTPRCSAHIRPAATMVEVSALISPDLLVEIEADALRRRAAARRDSGANRPSASGRYDVTLITAAAGSGPYRCGNTMPSGSVGTPGSQRTRRGQPCGIDAQQHQVGAAGVQPVRRQMHLLRRREVDEPVRAERVGPELAALLGRPPVVGAAEVDQHARQRLHTASLPRRQLGVTVRHDTPVNPWGTRPEPKTSETVDIRDGNHGGGHERNAHQSRTDQG